MLMLHHSGGMQGPKRSCVFLTHSLGQVTSVYIWFRLGLGASGYGLEGTCLLEEWNPDQPCWVGRV